MQKINIDLTAIKNSGKARKASNDHYYVDLIVQDRKTPDNQGNDLSVSISKSKEERESNAQTVYVGAGKTFIGNNGNKQAAQPEQQQEIGGDLPF